MLMKGYLGWVVPMPQRRQHFSTVAPRGLSVSRGLSRSGHGDMSLSNENAVIPLVALHWVGGG